MSNQTKEKSKIDKGYEDGAGAYKSLHDQEQQAAFDRDFESLTSPEHMAKEGQRPNDSSDTSNAINDKEEFPYSSGAGAGAAGAIASKAIMPKAGFNMPYAKAIFSQNKPGFTIGGFIVAALLIAITGASGPMMFLLSPANSMFATNDSAGPGMNRAFRSAFANVHKGYNDSFCRVNSAKIKCKHGRLSNNALHRLYKNGAVAVYADGTKYDGKKKRGYPDRSKGLPSHYEINGQLVKAAELETVLGRKGNFIQAAKIVGIRGAFNLKVRAYIGKHVKSKFYNPFGILRKGGLADGVKKRLSKSEKFQKLQAKMKSSMPGQGRINQIHNRVKGKVNKNIGKYKKGGLFYLISAGACAVMKAPKYLVSAAAAIQMLQLAPIVMDLMYSPKDKMMAHGVDYGEGINEYDLDNIGTVLNERAPNDEGKVGSALDSQYLMAAMGLVTATLPASKYAPGFTALNNPIIKAGLAAEKNPAVSAACNVILNPITMWSAAAVDLAVTAALSATIVLGIIKVVATSVAVWFIADKLMDKITELLTNVALEALTDEDVILSARGLKLGDIVGTSAMVMFPALGMSRLLPVVSESQFSDLSRVMNEEKEIERQLEIASLSPFDTSSKYTFLGSIINYMQMASLRKGHMGIHLPSVLASAVSPSLMFANASAANSPGYKLDNCDPKHNYAEVFNMKGDSPESTPLVNFAGMPCVGYTTDMPIDEALQILEDEGWIDPEVESDRDDLLLDELMPSGTDDNYVNGIGFIKPDNPLYEFINTCGNPDKGEHFENAAGCILPTPGSGTGSLSDPICTESGQSNCLIESEDPEQDLVVDHDNESAEGVKNPRAFEAISAFVLQYQVMQAINGEDDGPVTSYTGPIDGGYEDDPYGGGDGRDTGGGDGGGNYGTPNPPVVVTGSDQELAQKILNNSRITINPKYRYQFENYARGNSSCHLESDLLKLIASLGEMHSFTISSVNRQCTNTCPNGDWSWCRQSHHWYGRAVDFSIVDGRVSTGATSSDIALIRNASLMIPHKVKAIGQVNCRSSKINFPPGARVREHKDTCNHIHMALE